MAIQTGHGAAVVFATTSTFAPAFTSIGGPGWNRGSIDTSGLATTGARTMIGEDLWTIKPISSTYLMDPSTLATGEANSIDDLLFDSNAMTAAESAITITLSNTEASTFANGGHITDLDVEDLTTNALIAVGLEFQWDDTPTIVE